MVIVGEKINTSLKGITEAIKAKDKEFIQELAVRQSKQGSDYIDVNCGTLIDVEEEMLPWLVEIVQEVVDKPCCIDSPNPKALEAALKVHKGVPMINSITAEKSRYDDVINLVKQYDAKIVALLIDDANGISPSDEVRTKIGIELINKMYEDGATDYITSAHISLDEIKNKAQKFVKEGNFVGMPKTYPNRNEIRWYALNEFLGSPLEYHVIPEFNKEKYSGRKIRKSILDNDRVIPKETRKLLPKTTIDILEDEIAAGRIPGQRNWAEIYKRMNTYSRGNLEKIAYLNGNTINEIIKRRVYRDPESIWAVFRRANYGPVMTRLAVSAIEEEVTKKEVMDLMKSYESKGVIPEGQKVQRVIDRAWYVASESEKGVNAKTANETFRSKNIKVDNPPLNIHAGLNLTKFETKIISEGLNADLYIDKDNKISVQLKAEGKKIKTNLRLPAKEVTYLRYIMDSNFIPTSASIRKDKKGYKVDITIG